MRKIFILFISLLMLSACANGSNQDIEKENLSIICPAGAPALGFYNKLDNLQIAEAGIIKAQVLSNDKPDIAVLPTNVAVALINGGAEYKLASTITFGNFYICSTGNDEDGIMSKEDNIVLFGEGSIPDLVFHYVYGNEFDDAITYVNDASVALREIVSSTSEADYVLIAQPALFTAISKNEKAKEYANLQELYYEKSGCDMYQASIIVSNNIDHDVAVRFLSEVEEDINALLENPEIIKSVIEEKQIAQEDVQSLFGNVDADISVIKNNNGIGIGYKNAYDNKQAIDIYLELFNLKGTNEEIYFQ